MKKTLLTTALLGLSAVGAQAALIYSNDFSSAQTIISASNGATNYIGAGAGSHGQANINYGEWMKGRSSNRNQLTYDGGNGNVLYETKTFNSTLWHLVDTSAISSTLNGQTATLSFDVSNLSNDKGAVFTVSVWDGSGLTFSGVDSNTADGFLTVRSDGSAVAEVRATSNTNTSAIVLNNGTGQAQDGSDATATQAITGNGLFSMDFEFNGATGDSALEGGYILIGLGSTTVNPGASFNMDNFQIATAAVPEPSSTALLGLGGLALILRRRK